MDEKTEILFCDCGSCSHWELVRRGKKYALKCLTCKEEFPATVKVQAHDKLKWMVQE